MMYISYISIKVESPSFENEVTEMQKCLPSSERKMTPPAASKEDRSDGGKKRKNSPSGRSSPNSGNNGASAVKISKANMHTVS
jgi:hypothetical protein